MTSEENKKTKLIEKKIRKKQPFHDTLPRSPATPMGTQTPNQRFQRLSLGESVVCFVSVPTKWLPLSLPSSAFISTKIHPHTHTHADPHTHIHTNTHTHTRLAEKLYRANRVCRIYAP